MNADSALWLIAKVFSAACLSIEEADENPGNLDAKTAHYLADKCKAILHHHEVVVYAITESGDKIQLPSKNPILRGVVHRSTILAERNRIKSDINFDEVKMYSDQFMPGIWEVSNLKLQLEKAFTLAG